MSLATMCQFLCMMAVSCLPMSEKGVIMGAMLVSVCGVHWDNGQLQWVKAFFMFLMMRCSGYMRGIRILSSVCRIWSSEMIML